MTEAIDNLASAIANIKCLGATQEISIAMMSDMELRHGEEHARKNICHMMGREIAEGIETFQEKIVRGKYTGDYDPKLQLRAEVFVITPEDYKLLITAVKQAQRYLDHSMQVRRELP